MRTALARLVTRGVDAVWLPEVQPLLQLPQIQTRLGELAGEDAAARALREVLNDSIEQLGRSQYRSLLKIVLGLEPKYAELSAGARREIAGKEFRGGHDPVSPGTIRQHHEPKALDELAAILLSPQQPRADGGRDASIPGRGRVDAWEWHPAVRRAWGGEQLGFWRIALRDYEPEAVTEKIKGVTRAAGVSAWAVHETFGVFDLLLRAWLPAEVSGERFQRMLLDALSADLDLLDQFLVDEVVTHWPWVAGSGQMRQPDPSLLTASAHSKVAKLEDEERDAALDRYREGSLMANAPEGPGIGFAVAIVSRPSPLSPPGRDQIVQKQIMAVLDAASGEFSEVSLFRGYGFAGHLLQARVRSDSFAAVRHSLIGPLNESLRALDCRTYTSVFSTLLAREEKVPGGSLVPEEPTVRELLESGEGPELEIRGGAFRDLRLREEKGAHVTEALMRTITGFLNADGGTIIVGAFDKEAVGRDSRFLDLREMEGTPEVGNYVVSGIDFEMEDGFDRFSRRLSRQLEKFIEPQPQPFVQMRLEQIEGRSICVVTVAEPREGGPGGWFYLRARSKEPRFFVRSGTETVELAGLEADLYKVRKARSGLAGSA